MLLELPGRLIGEYESCGFRPAAPATRRDKCLLFSFAAACTLASGIETGKLAATLVVLESSDDLATELITDLVVLLSSLARLFLPAGRLRGGGAADFASGLGSMSAVVMMSLMRSSSVSCDLAGAADDDDGGVSFLARGRAVAVRRPVPRAPRARDGETLAPATRSLGFSAGCDDTGLLIAAAAAAATAAEGVGAFGGVTSSLCNLGGDAPGADGFWGDDDDGLWCCGKPAKSSFWMTL